MKFGKSLSNQIDETLPEWRDKFLSYKELKKRLKLIEPKIGDDNKDSPNKRRRLGTGDSYCSNAVVAAAGKGMLKEESDFSLLLEAELEKFNTFFVEQEEEYIIRLKELQERVAKAKDGNEEMINIRKEIVDFHGEMVLLENYSSLNYTGLVKILKKYDKRTGALVRLPFIQRVLQQPFFTTDLLYKLVKECEAMLDSLFTIHASNDRSGDQSCEPSTFKGADGSEIELVDSSCMKSTISALRVLKEIRSGSSTVSVFSLPPLKLVL
jgi:SPX domain protein involved in polyphosphate accumulation